MIIFIWLNLYGTRNSKYLSKNIYPLGTSRIAWEVGKVNSDLQYLGSMYPKLLLCVVKVLEKKLRLDWLFFTLREKMGNLDILDHRVLRGQRYRDLEIL